MNPPAAQIVFIIVYIIQICIYMYTYILIPWPGKEDSWQLGQHQLHGPERGHRQWPEVGDSLWEIFEITFDLHHHNWDISNVTKWTEFMKSCLATKKVKFSGTCSSLATIKWCEPRRQALVSTSARQLRWGRRTKSYGVMFARYSLYISSLLDINAKMITHTQAVILATYSEPIVPEQV